MTRRALVVEDDKLLAEVLTLVLKRMGYDPTALHEGTDAVEWAQKNQPDVVLLDLMLPGKTGYEICRELKLDRATNLIPIVIVTALAQREALLRGLSVGANYYLVKPFTMDQLEHAVKHVLSWRQELQSAGAGGEIHFQLQSDSQHLEELNRLLASLFLFTGLTQQQVFELTTAVREMGQNAIEWGNRNQTELAVTLTYRIEADKVVIVIRDEGPGFKREELAHAARADDPTAHMEVRESKGLRVGGFGMMMTRGLVDELQYNDTGNEVRLVKRFAARTG